MNNLIERFEDKFIPEPNSGCWIWVGAVDSCRYARFGVMGKNCKASRISYRLYKCEEPGSLHVLHSCDVPECVNPDHLFLGTHQENMEDRDNKGRQWDRTGRLNPNAGSKNHKSKLKENDVRTIRSLIGRESYQSLAARYGVSAGSIQKIANGTNWGWLQ